MFRRLGLALPIAYAQRLIVFKAGEMGEAVAVDV